MYQNYFSKAVLLLISALNISLQQGFSQDSSSILFGKVALADFVLPKSSVIDSSTNAVVIAKTGTIEFVGRKDFNWVSYVFKKHVRVKILNKKAFDFAKIFIALHGTGTYRDQIEDLQASTYNIENGHVVETKLIAGDTYDVQINNSLLEKRFTLPALKEGSIIEYSYKITSFNYGNLPDWNFQNMLYPCLYSEFRISVPDLLRYITIRYGIDSFYSFKSSDTSTLLKMYSVDVKTNIHNHTWVMKDIPAFNEEDFIISPETYLDKLEFTLTQFYSYSHVMSYAQTWDEVYKSLMADKDFGKAIEIDNTDNLYNTMAKNCSTEGDIMQAATQIYFYVRDKFTCIPNSNIYPVSYTHLTLPTNREV